MDTATEYPKLDRARLTEATRRGGALAIVWGQNLRDRRELHELNASQLAERVGIARNVVRRIESGKMTGSDAMRMALAYSLNCDVSEIWAYPDAATLATYLE